MILNVIGWLEFSAITSSELNVVKSKQNLRVEIAKTWPYQRRLPAPHNICVIC